MPYGGIDTEYKTKLAELIGRLASEVSYGPHEKVAKAMSETLRLIAQEVDVLMKDRAKD